jgi:hypothetical protein
MKKSRKILRWIGINLCIGVLIPFVYATDKFFSLAGWAKVWDDILYSFLVSMAISGTVGIIEYTLNKRIPWLKTPVKRAILELLLVSVLTFSAAFLVNVLFYSAFGMIDYSAFPMENMIEQSIIPTLIGYGITAFFLSRSFLFKWREEALQGEKMRAERFRGEAQLLRDQLNPHFLFNTLNVLTNMVYEDADRSADYIRKLSKFYRYVLEVQNEDLISLEQELNFSQSYFLLQQSRFGDTALQLQLRLPNVAEAYIPPLVLQLLLENCIKHNKIEDASPLQICISVESDYLLVQNNKQKRTAPAESTGVGLRNIKERYKHLTEKEVSIEESATAFEVKIPLLSIKPTQN